MHYEIELDAPIRNRSEQEKKVRVTPNAQIIAQAWEKIMPLWPLKNWIACNPLHGFEHLAFEEALKEGNLYFQQKNLPKPMHDFNRQTIKWCQCFFDQGQATLTMPYRNQGFYTAWKHLAEFDHSLHRSDSKKISWIKQLPNNAEQAVFQCLKQLHIPPVDQTLFLTLLLTTLPGWAGYVKYATQWSQENQTDVNPICQMDYLAVRVALLYLTWPQAACLIEWYYQTKRKNKLNLALLTHIEQTEDAYQANLMNLLLTQNSTETTISDTPLAQVVFCIDVRSEPLRVALEKQNHYETLGFAGFFGLPVRIDNEATGETYASCPVLLEPKHKINEQLLSSSQQHKRDQTGRKFINRIRQLYQSLKYKFMTPFALVEMLGLWNGLWMTLRTLLPLQAEYLKKRALHFIRPSLPLVPSLVCQADNEGIDFADQCTYAENALKMMGLTHSFAPLVVFCGHGSTSQNNAYASALDCGACGGRHGGHNAKILAAILNSAKVREVLATKKISIPKTTTFIAAEHNTTTDEITLYPSKDADNNLIQKLSSLQNDLATARILNTEQRCKHLGSAIHKKNPVKKTLVRSTDWAQTRPEWGLAGNACFIVAPRALTKRINLEGRAFLHSYDWQQDTNGTSLTTILTAPMIVAQWINNQYLYSTMDNVAYGSGSKVTQNVYGKIGIMQGNASDLMQGLPLQSVYKTDDNSYHQTVRLLTVVYAPIEQLSTIISSQAVLQKLFKNGWVKLICIDPKNDEAYKLRRNLLWEKIK